MVPPFWHRHPELLWELSALHLHWLCAYDAEQNGSAPLGWHRDFAEARLRLRDLVAASGTRLDRDRPTRQTSWPGEEPAAPVEDLIIDNREENFVQFVLDDVTADGEAPRWRAGGGSVRAIVRVLRATPKHGRGCRLPCAYSDRTTSARLRS